MAVTVLPETAARILLVKLGCAAVKAPTSSCSGPSSGIVGWLNDLLECFLGIEREEVYNWANLYSTTVQDDSLPGEQAVSVLPQTDSCFADLEVKSFTMGENSAF